VVPHAAHHCQESCAPRLAQNGKQKMNIVSLGLEQIMRAVQQFPVAENCRLFA
jgi:hypothetical protein